MENLKALVNGKETTPCQRSLALREFVKMEKDLKQMHSNMQYYMEYCQSNGYVTPMKWLDELKHF